MAHVKGLSESTGRPKFKPYDPGEYIVECEDWKEDDRDNMLVITIKMSILEGPDQKDEREVEGKPFTTNIVILKENHPSFNEEMDAVNVGELKEAIEAFGIKLDGDAYDPEDFIEKTAKVKLGVKKPSKKEIEQGYDENRNVVRRWMPDDGAEEAESYAE